MPINTRPTADRVRESLFNILQGGRFGELLADCHVIDLFAGTGALGLEAISRGASFASFVENNGAALTVLRANIAKLQFQSSTTVLAVDAYQCCIGGVNRRNWFLLMLPIKAELA